MLQRRSKWSLGVGLFALFPTTLLADAPLDSELSQAMAATSSVDAGRDVYKLCVVCHQSDAWGTVDGSYPQLAGQHRNVIIKQIADIRAGNRDNPAMLVIAKEKVMGGPQAIADVTAYIQTLPMTPEPGVGPGVKLKKAERLYFRKCAECHGSNGQGDNERYYPRIQGQHYSYLLRQLQWIKNGKRRNAYPEMAKRINKMKEKDLALLADFVSRMKPPAEDVAPVGWKNPDFD